MEKWSKASLPDRKKSVETSAQGEVSLMFLGDLSRRCKSFTGEWWTKGSRDQENLIFNSPK